MSEKLSEAIIEILVDYANAQEANAVNMKHRIAELLGVKEASAVKEETFNILSYERQTGNKIGAFEVADRSKNDAEKFQRALNILKNNNATIANRYHAEGYMFGYWVYQDRIYKQTLKTK